MMNLLRAYWTWATRSKWRLAAGIGGPLFALVIIAYAALAGGSDRDGSSGQTAAASTPTAAAAASQIPAFTNTAAPPAAAGSQIPAFTNTAAPPPAASSQIPAFTNTAAPPPATAAAQGAKYTVQPGDSLSQICSETVPSLPTGVCVSQIVQINGLASASQIEAGQELTLPGGSGQASGQTPTQQVTSTVAPATATLVAGSPTQAPPSQTFGDGIQIVGVDILAGTYRARSSSSFCSWARLSGLGGTSDEIIANATSSGPAVATISSDDTGFESTGCGSWTADLSAITTEPTAPFGDGTFIVGTDIAPGTWQAAGGNSCNWARLSGFRGTNDSTIASNIGIGGLVTISPTDAGFTSSGCFFWTFLG